MVKLLSLIMDNVYLGTRFHQDPLLNETCVSGSYLLAMWERNLESKVFWLGDYKYILLVGNKHYYKFTSTIDYT